LQVFPSKKSPPWRRQLFRRWLEEPAHHPTMIKPGTTDKLGETLLCAAHLDALRSCNRNFLTARPYQ
jgi:hypothetical protein